MVERTSGAIELAGFLQLRFQDLTQAKSISLGFANREAIVLNITETLEMTQKHVKFCCEK